METSTAETINKVYAILTWLGAVLLLIAAVVLFAAGTLGGALGAGFGLTPEESAVLAGAGIVFSILLLAFAIFSVFLGIGIWRKRNWARIVAVIFAVLGIVSGLMQLAGAILPGLLQLIISGFFLWFYGIAPEGKALFTATPVVTPAFKAEPARAPRRTAKRPQKRSRR